MRISDETIQRVQSTADVLEVVEDYVTLKKKGANWWALSPFTEEKSPSFSVSPQKGIYKCFSTGKGGDAISFVMEMEGIGFLEAIRHLAKKYNIPIEEETSESKDEQTLRESLFIALNFAKTHYHDLLHHHADGQAFGLSYFKERGFSKETIQKFELGFSLDQWDTLYKEATAKGFNADILEAAGLIVRKEGEGKLYDRFRGRVMFPIHNVSGRVIGFGARTLKKDDKPKYLNSPESEVYHKSFVLYGFFQAKNAIRSLDNCYLVEGYTDVISLHQAGIENVVASSGTSLTEEQIKLIGRFTQNITVLYDGDPAGIKASLRGIDLILEKGLDVRVATFPNNDDPDSFVRKIGGDAFKKYLAENVQDFLLFRTRLGLDEIQNDPIKKANLIREIVASITKMPDSIKRSVFFQQCSHLLGIEESVLVAESNKIFLDKAKKPKKEEVHPQSPIEEALSQELEEVFNKKAETQPHSKLYHSSVNAEKELIRILILHGGEETESEAKVADFIFSEISGIPFRDTAHHEIISSYQEQIARGHYPDHVYFIRSPLPGVGSLITSLIMEKGTLSKNWQERGIYVPLVDENLTDVILKAIKRLKFFHVCQLLEEVEKKLAETESFSEQLELMKLHLMLKQDAKNLGSQLGIVVSH